MTREGLELAGVFYRAAADARQVLGLIVAGSGRLEGSAVVGLLEAVKDKAEMGFFMATGRYVQEVAAVEIDVEAPAAWTISVST